MSSELPRDARQRRRAARSPPTTRSGSSRHSAPSSRTSSPPPTHRKYWTTEPRNLGTDWIGARVFYPSVEDVKGGYEGPLGRSTYWVKKFRYPSHGGFGAFTDGFAKDARINYGRSPRVGRLREETARLLRRIPRRLRRARLDAAAACADWPRRGRSRRRARGSRRRFVARTSISSRSPRITRRCARISGSTSMTRTS